MKEKDQDKEGERLRWKFRRVRALVVDEGSLVSVQILHSLLAILTNEARLQKFIMLGGSSISGFLKLFWTGDSS